MKRLILFFLAIFSFVLFSCSEIKNENNSSSLSILLPNQQQRALATFQDFEKYSNSYYKIQVIDSLGTTQEKKATMTSTSVEFDDITEGNCQIEMNAYMDAFLVASGKATALIKSNETTSVSVKLSKIDIKPVFKTQPLVESLSATECKVSASASFLPNKTLYYKWIHSLEELTSTTPTNLLEVKSENTEYKIEKTFTITESDNYFYCAFYEKNENNEYVNELFSSKATKEFVYTEYSDLKTAIEAVSEGDSKSFYVSGNLSANATITINGNITIKAYDDCTITRANTLTTAPILNVTTSAALKLNTKDNCTFKLDGNNISNATKSLIIAYGTLELSNINMCNSKSSSNGSAIYNTSNSSITIDNCEFSYCESTGATGGGVLYAKTQNLTIKNSKIHHNKAAKGGAIYCTDGNSTTLTISDCYIYSNNSTSNGGALYLKNCIGTIENTRIEDNSTSYANATPGGGGAIYLAGATTSITITNTDIKNNTASNSYGGGIYMHNGSITRTGGSISNNTANTGNGNQVYKSSDSTYIVDSIEQTGITFD